MAEGMLCHVAVPGREIAGTLRLPRHSVSYEGKVRVNRDGRLKTLNVEVAHRDDKFVYVSKGLLPHEHVIVSPLSVPLENSLLLEHPMKDRGIDPLPAKADGIANKKKPASHRAKEGRMKSLLHAFARNTVFANIAIVLILATGWLASDLMTVEGHAGRGFGRNYRGNNISWRIFP